MRDKRIVKVHWNVTVSIYLSRSFTFFQKKKKNIFLFHAHEVQSIEDEMYCCQVHSSIFGLIVKSSPTERLKGEKKCYYSSYFME